MGKRPRPAPDYPPPAPAGYTISPLKLFVGGLVLVVVSFTAGVLVQSQLAPSRVATPSPAPFAAGVPSPAPFQSTALETLQAIQQLKQHLEHAPQDLEARVQLANALFDIENYQEAITHYRLALDQRPGDPDVRTDLGTALHRLGRNDLAVQEFRKAIQDAPNHLNAHYNLGVVLANELNDPKGAIAAWERVLELAPNSPQAAQVRASLPQLKARQ